MDDVVHTCRLHCTCAADQATAKVHECQKAVDVADKTLMTLRNTGVDEEVLVAAELQRHTAQVNLDAAYKALIELNSTSMPWEKIKNVDELDAEDSDSSDDEGAAGHESDISLTLDNMDSSDDEDYHPDHAH